MTVRIQQPPVDRTLRAREQRGAAPALILCVAAALATYLGWTRLTGVETTTGDRARELEVNAAMAHGGIKVLPPPKTTTVPPPNVPSWVRLEPDRAPDARSRWGVEVGSKDPCPT